MKSAIIVVFISFSAFCSYSQFQPDVRLTNNPGESIASPNNARCVAASNDTIHVIWRDNRFGNREIFYKRSLNGGVTWGEDVRLTFNAAPSEDPCIAVSGSTVHIVWSDMRDGNWEIYYKRSVDGGTSWGTDTRLTIDANESVSPSVAVCGTTLHLVWMDARDLNAEIYYKRSADAGLGWGADVRLTNTVTASYNPCIAVTGTTVHVVWEEEFSGTDTYEIHYVNSPDAGATWGADTRLTWDDAESLNPCIAASGANVHVTWYDDRDGNEEIYCKNSADGGQNWGADTRLTSADDTSYRPSVCTDGQNVHISWVDYRDGNNEIYYKKSSNNGNTWDPDLRLTNNAAPSWRSSVALAGTAVHVVWEDTRDGNYEIYYKQDPTGSVMVIPGDANCDGIVNVLDVITVINWVFGQIPDPFCFANADVNADGIINVLDVIGTVNVIFEN
ncbi:MAG TPA: exo-alpha-sialidase [Bacteroidales bacterium]|nr:exo-alpha-sialidase [Bacteroidales bacterium]HNS46886.1 exo-alpha-sialidase [Bacteroidales bacterium]